MAGDDKGRVLIALGREAIALQLGMDVVDARVADASWLNESAATFVTLIYKNTLRGCVGSLEAYRPLRQDVQANAIAAAFHDSRFLPLCHDEYSDLQVEVSLLSALQPLDVIDENDALRKIRPNIDGLVLQCVVAGVAHKATFLPQVWDALPDPTPFMRHLKVKAGLNADFWHPDMRLFIYQVHKYCEPAGSRL